MDNSHLNDLDLDAFAQALADAAESRGLLQAPANLKESILERSRQPDMVLQAQSNRFRRLYPHGSCRGFRFSKRGTKAAGAGRYFRPDPAPAANRGAGVPADSGRLRRSVP